MTDTTKKRYIARWWKSLTDGKWYFSLSARNGEAVLPVSASYKRERSALKTLAGFNPVIYRQEKIKDPAAPVVKTVQL